MINRAIKGLHCSWKLWIGRWFPCMLTNWGLYIAACTAMNWVIIGLGTLHFLISVPGRLLIFDISVTGYAVYSGGYGNFLLGLGHPVRLASAAWLRTGRLTPGRLPTWQAVILSQFRATRVIIISHSQEIMFRLISKQCTCNLQMTFVNKTPLISTNQLQISRWFGPMGDNGAIIWQLNLVHIEHFWTNLSHKSVIIT